MKKGKIILSILAILLIFTSFKSFSFAASNYQYVAINMNGQTQKLRQVAVLIDGQPMAGDMPSFIYNNRTLVPVRFVAEGLGMDVKWNQKDKTVTLLGKGKKILLEIDSPYAYVNGNKQTLPSKVAPKLIRDKNSASSRTMVPIAFISETIGHKVGWDGNNSIAYIETKKDENKKDENKNVTNLNKVKKIAQENINGKDAIVIYNKQLPKMNKMKLSSPDRIAIDLSDSLLGTSQYNYDMNIGAIEKVRTSQFKSDVVRVVLDIKSGVNDPKIKMETHGDKIVIFSEAQIQQEPNHSNDEYINPKEPNRPNDEYINPNKKPNERLIVIDPGHGGGDPGAIPNEVREKDITLSISHRLNEKLMAKGYNTFMTREGDYSVDLYDRPKIANEKNADIFVSIHCNSCKGSTVSGFETLYCPIESKKVAAYGDNYSLAKMVQDELIKELNAVNRGVKKRPNLVVLNRTEMPAILVENGFLSNPEDEKLLLDNDYQDRIAEAISRGIERYFNEISK